jgi:hypothetical protein
MAIFIIRRKFMPQISLKISSNINISDIHFESLFFEINRAMMLVPDLNVDTCHSGLLQEKFSFIGRGDPKKTRIFLEILWLENEDRKSIKAELVKNLIVVLNKHLQKPLEAQGLNYAPRIRIADLGKINQDYFIFG